MDSTECYNHLMHECQARVHSHTMLDILPPRTAALLQQLLSAHKGFPKRNTHLMTLAGLFTHSFACGNTTFHEVCDRSVFFLLAFPDQLILHTMTTLPFVLSDYSRRSHNILHTKSFSLPIQTAQTFSKQH